MLHCHCYCHCYIVIVIVIVIVVIVIVIVGLFFDGFEKGQIDCNSDLFLNLFASYVLPGWLVPVGWKGELLGVFDLFVSAFFACSNCWFGFGCLLLVASNAVSHGMS